MAAEPIGGPDTPPEPGLRRALEGILLVVDEPVPVDVIAEALEAPGDEVEAALTALAACYREEERGFVLRSVAGGWRLYTDPAVAPAVERFVLQGRSGRLSQAALETLAIVAYQQPVTRSRISEIRGVDADGAVRSLLARGLVTEVGRDASPGQPLLYGTTPAFLEQLGLSSLEELPPLPDLGPDGPLPAEPPVDGYRAARRVLSTPPEEPRP
ncbi:MAG: SMC-Scp complex subunit ScpB [Actinomycetota bacterium]